MKNLLANFLLFTGAGIQKIANVVTGVGLGLHMYFDTEKGKKIKEVNDAFKKLEDQLKNLENTNISNKKDDSDQMQKIIDSAKKQEDDRLKNLVKGDKKGGPTFH